MYPDWFPVGCLIVGALLGGVIGWSFVLPEVRTVYVKDDGEGGITPAPEFDPDAPMPGDPLYLPDEWLTSV